MSTQSLAPFLIVTLAVLVVPGPSVVFVVTSTLRQGRAAGLVAVAGLETGLTVHVVATSLGLSGLVASSPSAFGVLKVGGAAYLVVLGLTYLRDARAAPHEAVPAEPRGRAGIFRAGVLMDLLNPKTVLFFVALFPQFVDPGRGGVRVQVLALGGIVVVLAALCDSGYAVLTHCLRGRRPPGGSSRPVAALPGGALLCVAAFVALS